MCRLQAKLKKGTTKYPDDGQIQISEESCEIQRISLSVVLHMQTSTLEQSRLDRAMFEVELSLYDLNLNSS